MRDLTTNAGAPRAPRPPKFFEVPAGTPATKCRECDAVVYPIRTATGHLLPVDCEIESGAAPSPLEDAGPRGAGVGVSHLLTCPGAGVTRG